MHDLPFPFRMAHAKAFSSSSSIVFASLPLSLPPPFGCESSRWSRDLSLPSPLLYLLNGGYLGCLNAAQKGGEEKENDQMKERESTNGVYYLRIPL